MLPPYLSRSPGDGRVADEELKNRRNVQFFSERVEDPTDNKAARCFARAA
jgi:hypothetical protein